MTPEQKLFLDVHIPYRLRAIDGLRWVCELLLADSQPGLVEVTFDSKLVIRSPSYRFLTNPMLEMGAVYCRVLLEFLGITLTKGKLASKSSVRQDDVGIDTFGLKQVTLAELRSAPFGDGDQIEQACVTTILIAHKAVAHLTIGHQPDSDLQRLHLSSRLVPWLVSRHLYVALGLPEPLYRVEGGG